MAMATTAKHGATFNKKSSIIVHGGGGPTHFDTRVNNGITTTPTSGALETKYNTSFSDVWYYTASASGGW